MLCVINRHINSPKVHTFPKENSMVQNSFQASAPEAPRDCGRAAGRRASVNHRGLRNRGCRGRSLRGWSPARGRAGRVGPPRSQPTSRPRFASPPPPRHAAWLLVGSLGRKLGWCFSRSFPLGRRRTGNLGRSGSSSGNSDQ